jgi:hypothetical protein
MSKNLGSKFLVECFMKDYMSFSYLISVFINSRYQLVDGAMAVGEEISSEIMKFFHGTNPYRNATFAKYKSIPGFMFGSYPVYGSNCIPVTAGIYLDVCLTSHGMKRKLSHYSR